MVKHLFESVQIEAVPDVLLVNFGEEGVILQGAEPADPAIIFFRTIGVTR